MRCAARQGYRPSGPNVRRYTVGGTAEEDEDMTQQPPDPVQQDVLGQLARWVVTGLPVEPGWDELHLYLRPLRDAVSFRLVEVRGQERVARLGRLTPEQAPYALARRLQDLGVDAGAGTWVEAALTLAATGWPTPTYTVTGRFNRDADPAPWREGDAPLDATDLVHHLTRYPRRPEAVPAWMSERVAAAGLDLPPYREETPGRQEPAAPVGSERRRVEALDVVVDRDGPTLPDGTRPGRRRLRLGGSLALHDVLETVGSPLPFVDDHGTWIVRRGTSRTEGPVLAVVEQGPGASTGAVPSVRVHLVTDAGPADLADDDGRLPLYYCSAPGELQVVLDSARLGEATLPPRPVTPPDNEPVRAAVAEFAADPGPQRMLDVLRQVLGGRLVVDATGSELPTPGTPSPELRLATLTAPDGTRALGVFTSNASLVEFRRTAGGPDTVTGIAQHGARLLEMFHGSAELTWFIVDPAGPSCAIGHKEAELALAAPSAVAVKDLLARDHTTQELLAALSEPDAALFIAHAEIEGRTGPVLVRDRSDGRPLMLAFTSPVEVAAYNQKVGVRRLPVGAVFELVLANRAKALVINPGGPRAVLPGAQVWHALGNPDLPPPPPEPAAGTPDDAPGGP